MIANYVTEPLTRAERQRRLLRKTHLLHQAAVLAQAKTMDELRELIAILKSESAQPAHGAVVVRKDGE